MTIIIILGTEIMEIYERKSKQQIIGSTRRLYITRTWCFSDNTTNRIPQVNIAKGPSNILSTWRNEWCIGNVSVMSTRIKQKKDRK